MVLLGIMVRMWYSHFGMQGQRVEAFGGRFAHHKAALLVALLEQRFGPLA